MADVRPSLTQQQAQRRSSVLAAVTRDGNSLQYASPAFQNDPEVVLRAIDQNPSSFQYASLLLRNCEAIAWRVVQRGDGVTALRYASRRLQDDKALVLAAVQQNWWAWRSASPRCKVDKQVVMAVLRENGYALRHVTQQLQADVDVVWTAVEQNAHALQYADETTKDHRGVVMAAVANDGCVLQYASTRLRRDRSVVYTAVRQNWSAMSFAADLTMIGSDQRILMAALEQSGHALHYASDSLKRDEQFVTAAVKRNGSALQYVADETLQGNWRIVMAAVQQDGNALQYTTSPVLRSRLDVVKAAVQSRPEAIRFASPCLWSNLELMTRVILPGAEERAEVDSSVVSVPELWELPCWATVKTRLKNLSLILSDIGNIPEHDNESPSAFAFRWLVELRVKERYFRETSERYSVPKDVQSHMIGYSCCQEDTKAAMELGACGKILDAAARGHGQPWWVFLQDLLRL